MGTDQECLKQKESMNTAAGRKLPASSQRGQDKAADVNKLLDKDNKLNSIDAGVCIQRPRLFTGSV
jgi:hypothetical protein